MNERKFTLTPFVHLFETEASNQLWVKPYTIHFLHIMVLFYFFIRIDLELVLNGFEPVLDGNPSPKSITYQIYWKTK